MTNNDNQKFKSISLFLYNPFNIYGISVSSSKTEILDKHERLLKLSKLKALDDYESDFTLSDVKITRDVGTLQNALIQSDKLFYRYLWFSNLISYSVRNIVDCDNFFQEYDSYLYLYLDLIRSDRNIIRTRMWEYLFTALDSALSNDIKYEDYKKLEERFYNFENTDLSFNLLKSYKEIPISLLKPLEFFIEEIKDDSVLNRLFRLFSFYQYLSSSYLMKIFINKFKLLFIDYKNKIDLIYREIMVNDNLDQDKIRYCFIEYNKFESVITSLLDRFPDKESFLNYEVLELIDIYKEINTKISRINEERCDYSQSLMDLIKMENYNNEYEKSDKNTKIKLYKECIITRDNFEKTKNNLFSANALELFQNERRLNLYIKAKSGDENSELLVGSILINENQDVFPYLPSTGIRLLNSAASKGNADAQYRLAGCYLEGVGVSQSVHTGVYWMRQAASRGHVEAITLVREYNL